jgi:uncharacterized protein (DUF2147 family)
MNDWLKKLAATIVLLGAISTPALAGGVSPVGSWQSSSGDTRVKVTLCGDGTDLCAKLTWLREDAKTARNIGDLGKYVVREAQRASDNAWKGEVHFNGQTANGKIELVSKNTIKLSGCKMGMCKSLDFTRI